jgi:hypothetical protein
MKRFKTFWMACCLLCAVAVARADAPAALEQQPAPLETNPKSPADHSAVMHPDQLQTVVETEATVLRADPEQHTLSARDMTGHAITLQTIANTRIMDPQNHLLTLADLKPKDHVRLYYDRKSNTVQQIDRLPSVGETILGQ